MITETLFCIYNFQVFNCYIKFNKIRVKFLEKKKICLLTSGHPPFDERIFWKFGIILVENNFDVLIISSTENLTLKRNGIQFKCFEGNNFSKNQKVEQFYKLLIDFNPDVAISCEPVTVIPANRYKRLNNRKLRIILDVTEFYPHQNTLNQFSGVMRVMKYIQLSLFNLYASNLADRIIAGETNKLKLYKVIAPFKKKSIITYYAPKKYFKFSELKINDELFFCFLGEQSEERGFFRFLEVISQLSHLIKLRIKIILIGSSFVNQNVQNLLLKSLIDSEKVVIEHLPKIEYCNLGSSLSKSHFFIDLREKNKIFNRSLPIRIFDYLACGRPIIFSNLNSFDEFDNLTSFVYLVDPFNVNEVVRIIVEYLNNPELYYEHCRQAKKSFEEKYNWELIESKLLEVVNE
jgi:glycosyltransferase involved in cell wall biosynthesis